MTPAHDTCHLEACARSVPKAASASACQHVTERLTLQCLPDRDLNTAIPQRLNVSPPNLRPSIAHCPLRLREPGARAIVTTATATSTAESDPVPVGRTGNVRIPG